MLRFMYEREIRMKFEWDEEKNRINKIKGNIKFLLKQQHMYFMILII